MLGKAKKVKSSKKKRKIAIDAADLCYDRVDGTRIYIKNVLDKLGKYDKDNLYYIYLKGELNPQLKFKIYPNYRIITSTFPFFWTQLKLPFLLFKDRPDILWMPLQTVPFLKPKQTKFVVTIHDLAFKIFPRYFNLKDRILLTLFSGLAIRRAYKIIAVSQNTRKDIIRFYERSPNDISVVYHGYKKELFNLENASNKDKVAEVKRKYKLKQDYILYAGALQPRKNVTSLVKAFDRVKDYFAYDKKNKDIKLVIAGARAWLYKPIFEEVARSKYRDEIIFTGHYKTRELPFLIGGSKIFVFPSFYEGFGIPVVEAMACAKPVICAKNSSLIEVGGDAVEFFDDRSYLNLSKKLIKLLKDEDLMRELAKKGKSRAVDFSWRKTALETIKIFEQTLQDK
ncbi:MAG: glycosyltransferase [Candidatus Moranbacteria bacterium]|nr:glycosyltransferase [Candidatus Moranbacteria bacterium]